MKYKQPRAPPPQRSKGGSSRSRINCDSLKPALIGVIQTYGESTSNTSTTYRGRFSLFEMKESITTQVETLTLNSFLDTVNTALLIALYSTNRYSSI